MMLFRLDLLFTWFLLTEGKRVMSYTSIVEVSKTTTELFCNKEIRVHQWHENLCCKYTHTIRCRLVFALSPCCVLICMFWGMKHWWVGDLSCGPGVCVS